MIFEAKNKVQLVNLNTNLELSNRSIIAFFEEAGNQVSESENIGLSSIKTTKKSWIVLNMKLEVIKRPKYNEEVIIKTWIRDISRAFCFRDYELYSTNNELLAKATAKWIYYDLEKGRIVNLKEISHTTNIDETRKVEIQISEKEKVESIKNSFEYKVISKDIDFNNHMHNLEYFSLAEEAIKYEPKKIEVEFKSEAKLGDVLTVERNNNSIIISNGDKINANIKIEED